MAIIRTVMGGAGMRDTTSAARVLASVTTSAWTPGALMRIKTARSPIAGLTNPREVFMSALLSTPNPVSDAHEDGRPPRRRQDHKMDLPGRGGAPTVGPPWKGYGQFCPIAMACETFAE